MKDFTVTPGKRIAGMDALTALRRAVDSAIATGEPHFVTERWWRAWVDQVVTVSVCDAEAAGRSSGGAPSYRLAWNDVVVQHLVATAIEHGKWLLLRDEGRQEMGTTQSAWQSRISIAGIRSTPREP